MKVPVEIEITIKKEYAELVYPFSDQEYRALKNSIKETKGNIVPIVVTPDGVVLDGHHRLRACKELNLEPKYEVMEFNDELQEKLFVIDSNLKRRHLNTFQITEIALKKKPIYEEISRRNMSLGGKGDRNLTPLGRVDEQIAKDAMTSRDTVSKVQFILQEADQDDLAKVRAGKQKINQVYKHIKNNKIRQQLLQDAAKYKFQSNVRINGACLYQGDVITVTPKKIAKNSVAMIFTDPPWGNEYLYLYKELGKNSFDVLRAQGHLVTYAGHGNIPQIIRYLEEAGLSYCSSFCVKHEGNHDIDRQKNMFLEMTLLLWFVKADSKKAKGLKQFSNYVDSKKVEKIEHEWQQSTIEAQYYIDALTVEGEIVFDPFMGSGTTGIASLKLNRKFIGIEIDREQFSIAADRLAKFGC